MEDATPEQLALPPEAYTTAAFCAALTNVCADCGRCLRQLVAAVTNVCADCGLCEIAPTVEDTKLCVYC